MSDKDSFVLVQLTQVQLTQSIVSNGSTEGSVHGQSMDGWSEISCPMSHRSTNSMINASSKAPLVVEGSAEGTANINVLGWHHVNSSGSMENCSMTSNGPIFSSNSTTKEVEQLMATVSNSPLPDPPQQQQQMDQNNDNNTVSSVGSRVPFSWAEITKIQPKFHNEAAGDIDHQKPKVFEQTPKIATRHLPKHRAPASGPKRGNKASRSRAEEEDIPMPSIPESDPFANKNDLGRRVRRSGKRGSRLKYPNGKRGGNRNRRKKNQK